MNTEQAQNTATTKQFIEHKMKFTDDELIAMKEKHTTDCIEIDSLEEKIKAVKDEVGPRIKELKEVSKSTRKNIRRGFEYQDRECFLCPNFTTGMMEFVDCETGEILQERKLFPDERQLKLITGTNS